MSERHLGDIFQSDTSNLFESYREVWNTYTFQSQPKQPMSRINVYPLILATLLGEKSAHSNLYEPWIALEPHYLELTIK